MHKCQKQAIMFNHRHMHCTVHFKLVDPKNFCDHMQN
jgi:hypothetical protein